LVRFSVMRVTVRTMTLVLLAVVLFAPFVAFGVNAFAFRWFYPQLVPAEFSVQAWERIFNANSRVGQALWNSTVIAFGVTLASLVIGLPAARALGMHKFRGKRVVEFLILAPTMVPPIVVSLGLSINFIRWGLSGTLFGVGLVHLVPVMPYVVLTLSGVFANYDSSYEDQARTLGASPLKVIWFVMLPAVFPGVVVAGLFAFLISWSQYILTLLIGSGQVLTMPTLLFSAAGGGDNANIAALALMFIGPAILILLLTSRYLGDEGGAFGGLGRV
jgi:putative spermidine/putrescine transport system permease protein